MGLARLGRAVVLELYNDTHSVNFNWFNDSESFQGYIDRVKAIHDVVKRLCILEDIAYYYVGANGFALSIEPAFFATHLQLVNLAGSYKGALSCGPPLPSTCDPMNSFSIVFHELFYSSPPKDEDTNLLCNSHVRRKVVWLPKMWDDAARAAIAGRRISFWKPPKKRPISGCGDFIGILVVDPPPSRYGNRLMQQDPSPKWRCIRELPLYMGGYVDFSPWRLEDMDPDKRKTVRSSIIEDICAHLDSQELAPSLLNGDGNGALIFTTVAENIAAANWMTVLELVKMSIRNLDWRMKKPKLPIPPLIYIEGRG